MYVLCILSDSVGGRFDSQAGRAAGCSRSVIPNEVSVVRFWYQAAICNRGQCIILSFAVGPVSSFCPQVPATFILIGIWMIRCRLRL